jgi:hypothetical protein
MICFSAFSYSSLIFILDVQLVRPQFMEEICDKLLLSTLAFFLLQVLPVFYFLLTEFPV